MGETSFYLCKEASGIHTVTSAPFSGAFSRRRVPFSSAAICFVMASPRPKWVLLLRLGSAR